MWSCMRPHACFSMFCDARFNHAVCKGDLHTSMVQGGSRILVLCGLVDVLMHKRARVFLDAHPRTLAMCAVQVIEPIQSRCAILRFTRLSDAEILSRLLYVCDQEKVQIFVVARSLRASNRFGLSLKAEMATSARCTSLAWLAGISLAGSAAVSVRPRKGTNFYSRHTHCEPRIVLDCF